ncbi:DUF397 domain-containing protein [Saccharopolyspora cebuensis]|uniref:DUF397 domain-containing protein n=1 Tax=Saccharopolyspora cebuensis TaxID=418759 RepID=A0ABV4CNH1_9PSEU
MSDGSRRANRSPEILDELAQVTWRASSYSGPEGNCVEVGAAPGVVGVRDSKDRDGAVLVFDRQRWSRFLAALRDGDARSDVT